MKFFLGRLFYFILPFAFAICFAQIYYTKSGGDLNRLGKIPYPTDYRDQFQKEFDKPQLWTNVSDLTSGSKYFFDVLIIGDSFSNFYEPNYQNALEEKGIRVLNFDCYNYNIRDYNPAQMLCQFMESDVLDSVKVKYVVLQMVERTFINNLEKINVDEPLSFEELQSKINRSNDLTYDNTGTLNYILNDVILYYRYGLFYKFDDHAYDSPVYKFSLTKPLFSANENQLLCYGNDVNNLYANNQGSAVLLEKKLKDIRGKLMSKGVGLIVLPAPDKYDLYYDYIVSSRHPKNNFYEYLKQFKDTTLVLNTKQLFLPYLEDGMRDLYFADDTHWSPKGAKIVADQLARLMKNK